MSSRAELADEARRQLVSKERQPEPAEHSHRLPRWVRSTIIALLVCMVLLTVALAFLTVYVYQANEYVKGRGKFRDAEAERAQQQTTEQVRQSVCDVLDHLPAGGLLDPTREEYRCGPGVPVDELPPEARDQLQSFADNRPLRTDNDKSLDDYYARPNLNQPAPSFAPRG